MLGVLNLGDAFCVGIMLGACRPMKQRDENHDGAWRHGRCSVFSNPGDAFCVEMMLGACRSMKQRDENYRNFRSNATFPKSTFLPFVLKFTSGKK